ncbi:hypothetical protein KA183_00765 [bacterium]|nr:hypothetical protein [bacterium]QQR59180.1 MAG: hypothetical protein IPG59_06725 [Candidatus Melainabacteria bacterium]
MKKGLTHVGVTKKIRRHLLGLEIDEPFTTRDLLNYGSRSAIDNCIYRLIQEGIIHRITRGVFVVKKSNGRHAHFTQREVAEIKAGAFGRKLQTHPFKKAKEIAIRLGLIKPGQKWIGECDELESTYEISGPSSSFVYEGKRIYLKKATRRKIQLGDSKAGLVMRALWYNGFWNRLVLMRQDAQKLAYQGLYFGDRREIHQSSALIPAWLSDILNLENNDKYIQARAILVA